MRTIVPRTFTEIMTGDTNRQQTKESQSLEAYREVPSYVLLGDPGTGKTTAFEVECEALGEQAHLTTARDFLTFEPERHPEWLGKTIFIDGLDEIRAGASDARTPFDAIRGRLDALGKPRFRLSCREADWLGVNDQDHLEIVSQDAKVMVLRLDPLTESDIENVLASHPDVDNAEALVSEAKEQGISDLLRNPMTLDLLAKAVAGGDGRWPESRKKTFEMACGQMVREHNIQHRASMASDQSHTPAHLLDAAGCLCAVKLIAGGAGYTLYGQPDNDYPSLDQYEYEHPDRLRLALATKLFRGVGPSDNRFTPVHRHVAEFLAARHLARIIHDGLPARRVIAMITGRDGGVVTELRGLSAWLAAHCQEVRTDLIERDPIGVGLYGDVRGFSLDEKRALLASLKRDGSRIYSWLGPLSSQEKFFQASVMAFRALAVPDMEPALKELLQDGNRDEGHQILTDLVLEILSQAAPRPRLAEHLLEMVRDDTRWPRCKETALRAFMVHCPDSQDKVSKLKALLADIQGGGVSDSDVNRLRGTLLTELYPDDITPSEIWSHFAEQDALEPIGKLWWLWDIVGNASAEHVSEFLDELNRRFAELRPVLELHHVEGLSLSLLARGLHSHGDQLDTVRLYDWLGVGQVGGYGWNGSEDVDDIRCWLEQRPEVQKDLCLEGLNRWPDSDDFNPYIACQRLYRATPPSDFGLWCLKQAVAKVNTEPRVAKHLLETAFYQSRNEGLSQETLREHVQSSENPLLENSLERWLASRSRREEQELKHLEWERTFTEEEQRREEAWLSLVRSNEAALCENRAAPVLLFQLSQFYFRADSANRGPKAVEEMLRGDRRLTKAVLQGFRGAVDRRDVPTFDEVLRLQARGHTHYLAWPFLAGLAEFERTASEDAAQWDDDRIRRALAFYCHRPPSDPPPAWYQHLLTTRPELVADVLVQCDAAEFRRGQRHLLNFSHLNKIWEPDHAQVVRHASLPLLRAFPLRCKLAHASTLANLLWAAIRHADRPAFQDLIERKLSRMSMNIGQRVYWLAAGFLMSSATFENSLSNLVQGREKRILHLTDFLWRGSKRFLIDVLEIAQLKHLVRLVGRRVSPVDIWDDRFHASAGHASDLLKSLIQKLATSPDKDAGKALDELLKDPALSGWRNMLSQAQDTQRVTRRDADYCHPTAEQVCQTLKGGVPANPGDLAALLTDRLNELAVQIRRGNTNDCRQYWEGRRGQSPAPKHEDDCRDALLSDLQQRLPQSIDAQPEGHYANDRRADIRVSYGGFQVPVEVKKNTHRDLWRAMRDQLMAKYASAPETNGYGIYLVFWFGKQYTQPSPSGKRPVDDVELKDRLEMTLSAEERRKISVCVIEVGPVTT